MESWSSDFVSKLGLEQVISNPSAMALEHFPPFLLDRSLLHSSDLITGHVKNASLRGHRPTFEVVPMPRAYNGDRPIVCADLVTRAAYAALALAAQPGLDPDSRAPETQEEFQSYGSTIPGFSHVVVADIAAFYEYIVPGLLADELMLRTDDAVLVDALNGVLLELSTLGRGIPQMLLPSDRLSDVYLAPVDRALARALWSFKRTADDYKILATDWDSANKALDLLEREVRAIGLILSASKTRVVRAGPAAMSKGSSAREAEEQEQEECEEWAVSPEDPLLEWHARWEAD